MPPKKEKPIWRPQPGPQTAFFQCPADELCYGGAAGGGKSDSIITDAIALCTQHPGYHAIIFRRLFPDLERSLIPVAREKMSGRAIGRQGGKVWTFPNGSVLRLSHMQREEDKEDHKSAEYDYIGFDELTTFSESQYIYLFSRLRGDKKVPRFMRSGTNPTGPGHSWVKDRFVEFGAQTKEDLEPFKEIRFDFAYGWKVDGKVYTDFSSLPPNYELGSPAFSGENYTLWKSKKSGMTRAFIPSLLWSNEILLKNDPKYVSRLRELPLKQQQALLYGKWSIMEGQFFSEWDPDIHVCKPFPIPKNWERYVGIDYGFTAPFSAIFIALDPNGKVYVYREIYGPKFQTEEQAKEILKSLEQGEKIEWFAADPAMWQQSGHGETHAQIYARHGLDLTPSSNRRVPGWAIIHEYLLNQKIQVFDNCHNLIRTLPSLTHSQSNPEDLDSKQEDHAADSLRYCLSTLRGGATSIHFSKDGIVAPSWWNAVKSKQQSRRSSLQRIRF